MTVMLQLQNYALDYTLWFLMVGHSVTWVGKEGLLLIDCPVGIFLINDCCGQAQPTVSGVMPFEGGFGVYRETG